MKMNESVNYIAPEVEVVNVVVEKGFEASGYTGEGGQGEDANF